MRWIVVCLAVLLTLFMASAGISHPAFDCEEDVKVDLVTPEDLPKALVPCAGADRMIHQDGKSLNSTTGDCGGAPGPC